MTCKYDEYQRSANACLGQSKTANPATRSSWLNLAQAWLEMIPDDHAGTASHSFDAAAQSRGTGQEKSSSSH